MSSPLRATVQSLEGDVVRVLLEDGQTLRLPTSACEGVPVLGKDVYLIAAIPGAEDAARQAVSRHLLNELMGPSSHSTNPS